MFAKVRRLREELARKASLADRLADTMVRGQPAGPRGQAAAYRDAVSRLDSILAEEQAQLEQQDAEFAAYMATQDPPDNCPYCGSLKCWGRIDECSVRNERPGNADESSPPRGAAGRYDL